MIEQVRTFISIELPPGAKQVMEEVVGELKAAASAPVRWVKPDNVHLTLKFLGNVDSALIPGLVDGVREAAAGLGSFHLAVARLGAFPNPARARVLWMGLEGDLESLSGLQQRIEAATARRGFPKDERSFAPHLTLGRVNSASSDQQRLLKDALSRVAMPLDIAFEVSEIVVMRSDLRPGGAVYTPLGRTSL
jgi:2'-5' RNA ligase